MGTKYFFATLRKSLAQMFIYCIRNSIIVNLNLLQILHSISYKMYLEYFLISVIIKYSLK